MIAADRSDGQEAVEKKVNDSKLPPMVSEQQRYCVNSMATEVYSTLLNRDNYTIPVYNHDT